MAALQELVERVAGRRHVVIEVITETIAIVDTHTGGEPTRVVFDCPIDLGPGSLVDKRRIFQRNFDHYRQAIVCEPRGSEVLVGALLTQPDHSTSVAGVIFFNNVGFLGMCGHGTMGVAVALEHLGRLAAGKHQLDTPVGTVEFDLRDQNRVSIQNVPSYRYRTGVALQMPGGQTIHGDIAWGGNWFYICEDHGLTLAPSNLNQLAEFTSQVRAQLDAEAITGSGGQLIDHVELVGPPDDPTVADAKNYVLCPGGAYDRSPCGTGTSAKLACLAADGHLAPGQKYRQQSIVGSLFEATFLPLADGCISPRISGQAYVNGQGQLLIDENDPFAMGLDSSKFPGPVS